MTMDRFHKAARDGILDILKEATKRDSNSKDEDGMTPTLWAAFEGNLDALRLLVGRGGDPNKSDHFGNTALHFSAARGHMNCVTFLANFGVNPWALDIDYHTPKELAAMNNRDEILRFLDGVIAKEEATNKKTVKAMKEKAKKDAEKRIKEFQKLQKKAEKAAAEEQKKLLKEREKMEKYNDMIVGHDGIMPHRPSTVLINIRKDNRKKQSPKYSEIVSNGTSSSGKKVTGAVYKKAQQKKFQKDNGSSKSEFKVGKVDSDGKRSISSLSGLRRDSEVMYVGKRGKISDVFETKNDKNSRSLSEPDIFHNADSGFGDDVLLHEPSSIFDRPGFGSVAFRNSITATLSALPSRKADDRDSAHASDKGSDPRSGMDDSIGSAGSLAQRNRNMPWDEEDIISDDNDDDDAEWSPLQLFLLSFGLGDYVQQFIDEQIDLEALMLLTEDDLKGLGLPTGPRKKLLKAIEDRKAALEDPGEVADSRL